MPKVSLCYRCRHGVVFTRAESRGHADPPEFRFCSAARIEVPPDIANCNSFEPRFQPHMDRWSNARYNHEGMLIDTRELPPSMEKGYN